MSASYDKSTGLPTFYGDTVVPPGTFDDAEDGEPERSKFSLRSIRCTIKPHYDVDICMGGHKESIEFLTNAGALKYAIEEKYQVVNKLPNGTRYYFKYKITDRSTKTYTSILSGLQPETPRTTWVIKYE